MIPIKKEDKRQMVCERCKKSSDISEIKFMPKGTGQKIALCKECIQKAKSKPSEGRIRDRYDDKNKKVYRCLRCKYQFKHDPQSLRSLVCPFCGKYDKVIEDKVDATTLLREIDDNDFVPDL